MKPAFGALAALLLVGGCQTGNQQYSLSSGEKGVFSSRNAGSPISSDRLKGLDEPQLSALLGAPQLDRKDGPARVLRYQSDGCTLFVSMYQRDGQPWRAEFADAYDPQLRPLPSPDQCAGSVAAQKRRAA
ncbi:MAG: hypothetical protein J0H77_09345 [Alphaproteobacteria bacterium]|nr:hypothetical protein [Alphaproteobacteria bacterium]